MTCFWEAIISKLLEKELSLLQYYKGRNDHKILIRSLKNLNMKVSNVMVQGTPLTQRQIDENYKHIEKYNTNSSHNGYDCSTCDPFILLLASIFKLRIKHNYNGTMITYEHLNSEREIEFNSTRNHIT